MRITYCSVNVHNVVAKKRDAATSHLQRLHAHMVRLDVDYVCGQFKRVVNGPVAAVFDDQEFMSRGSSPL